MYSFLRTSICLKKSFSKMIILYYFECIKPRIWSTAFKSQIKKLLFTINKRINTIFLHPTKNYLPRAKEEKKDPVIRSGCRWGKNLQGSSAALGQSKQTWKFGIVDVSIENSKCIIAVLKLLLPYYSDSYCYRVCTCRFCYDISI